MANSKDMTLKILACRQVYSGRNPRGDDFTIYEVDAANAQGAHINQKLRSFQPLPIGQQVEVTVTPFNSETHGKSYTLHMKGRSGSGGTARLNEMAEELEELRNRVGTLTGRVDAIEAMVAGRKDSAPPTSERPGYSDQELGEKFGDEPTW